MRDIRWMLRCVDIDDGKALKSKTGRIELWLSEDLTLLNVCDRERFATARILFIHEWWDIVDGNFTLATWSVKNCIAWTLSYSPQFLQGFHRNGRMGRRKPVPFVFHWSRVRVYVRVFFLSSPNDFCRLVRRSADTPVLRLCGRSNCKKDDVRRCYVRWCI